MTFSMASRKKMSESAKKRCTPEWRLRQSVQRSIKVDPEVVSIMYSKGASQSEIGECFQVSVSAIYRLMQKHKIKTRPMVGRPGLKREKNPGWKGALAGKVALHKRVNRLRGKPMLCEVCGSDGDLETIYDWANLTGNYQDINDYKRMCRSCHAKYDNKAMNFRGVKPYTKRPRGKIRI
jgi:hypothetical protein